MAANETSVDINLRAKADTQQARSEYDSLFADLKQGVTAALSAQGADTAFIGKVADEFDRLNAELKETGASGEVVAQKIAQLEQSLVAAASAEEKRVRQLKTNFEMALHEKDVQEEAAANQRRRRQEDQLAMEMQGRQLQKNTDLLEKEIMERLRAERVARESVQTTQAIGGAMQGAKRDIGGAALAAAYFVDDMQYGLRGIMNNIPQMAMAFGLGGGLAGVISIAAVALNFLWTKFGEAPKAKDETDKVKSAVDDMHRALKDAGDTAEKTFKADAAAYIADIERATGAWEKQVEQIEKVLSHQNEIAKVQLDIANQRLEIEKQNELAGAGSEEERKAITARYDARKGALNNKGAVDQAKRNLTATEAEDAMLRRQHGNVEGKRNDAMGDRFQNKREREQFTDEFGNISDQGKRVAEADKANAEFMAAQDAMRAAQKALKENTVGEAAPALQAVAERKEAEFNTAKEKRNRANVGTGEDRRRLESGEGLTFKGAKGSEDAATAQRAAQALKRREQLAGDEKTANEALIKTTEALAQIRAKQRENAEQAELRRLELERAVLTETAGFAKSGVDKVTADKQAAEKQSKEQAEEKARKLENDARAAEKKDPVKAAELRNKAEMGKLPNDATPEQRRAAELDAKERLEQARKQQQDADNKKQARGIGEKAGNLGGNLGEADAGKLDSAAEKIGGAAEGAGKSGEAFTSFAEKAVAEMERMKKQAEEQERKMKQLESQLKNSR